MSRIVIVRHGNTFASSEPPRRIGARSDPALTSEGVAQAKALADHFRRSDIRFDRSLAGPLRRTRETAEVIISRQRRPPGLEIAPWLLEIDHGIDEDAREADVAARIGVAALAAWDRDGTPPPGWHVTPERLRSDWLRFLTDVREDNVLLVTSNGIARFALLAAFPNVERVSLRLRTGAMGIITRSSSGRLDLACWDRRPDDTEET